MLFSKNMEPNCLYCKEGKIIDKNTILCQKKGVIPSDGACRKFRYDPLKRIPPRPISLDFSRFDDEDFSF